MKKWLWFAGAALLLLTFGSSGAPGTDVAKLQPVQVVCLSREGTLVTVQTDTGDLGRGETLALALEALAASASGEIFLETAEHILISPECLELVETLAASVRPSCTLCLLEGEPELEALPVFLNIHSPSVTLMEYRAKPCSLQTLQTANGRMYLVS